MQASLLFMSDKIAIGYLLALLSELHESNAVERLISSRWFVLLPLFVGGDVRHGETVVGILTGDRRVGGNSLYCRHDLESHPYSRPRLPAPEQPHSSDGRPSQLFTLVLAADIPVSQSRRHFQFVAPQRD